MTVGQDAYTVKDLRFKVGQTPVEGSLLSLDQWILITLAIYAVLADVFGTSCLTESTRMVA